MRWIAVGAVVVLLVAGGALAAVLLRDDGENDERRDHGTAAPPTVTRVPPRRLRARRSRTPSLPVSSSSPPRRARSIAQVRLLGPGVASLAALRQEAEALASDLVRDTAGPRRPDSGRQHGGRCARAAASRARGPSRVRGGGRSLPRSAPVPHPRTGAGGDRTGRGGAARLREPRRRRPGPPGRLHERLRQQRAARGRAGTEADAVASDTTRDRPRPAARRRQAGRSARRGPVLRAVHVEGVAARIGRRAPAVASSSAGTTRTAIRAARAGRTASPGRPSRRARGLPE